jgi:HIP---CoA ligase
MQQSSKHFSGLAIGVQHTLPAVISHVAQVYGDKPFAIGEDGKVTSFAGLARRVGSLGSRLLQLGVKRGDRAAILAPNSTEWIIAACAIMSIGAIMIPINTRFKGGEVRYVLEKAQVSVLFTVGRFLDVDYPAMVIEACGGAGQNRAVRDLDSLLEIICIDAPGFAPENGTEAGRGIFAAAAALATAQTTADILFTSGTTGMPKGAMHSHGQSLWMTGMWNEANDLTDQDRTAIVNPFFHSFGYRSGWLSALTAGMTIFPLATFDPARLLALIERERITQLSGAPTVFHALMEHPDFPERNLASLRTGHTGGAKTPPAIIEAGYEKFGFEIFLTSFGQTESTALISTNRPGDPLEAIIGTVGRPVAGVEVRMIDDTGQDVRPGEAGELLVRGPNVMQGYFEDSEQTAATIDAAGWLHTGDVAAIDGDGRLRILDRIKDIVIVGGFNAYPAEIEIMLGRHPAIAEVAVIGLPDERLGEVTAACVIVKPGMALDTAGLLQWSRDKMANYKVPRHVFVMADFPRTPLGKVQKFLLRQQCLKENGPLSGQG